MTKETFFSCGSACRRGGHGAVEMNSDIRRKAIEIFFKGFFISYNYMGI